METELLSRLTVTCLAASVGIVLVLALRWALRKLCGAALSYQAWLLVPSLIVVALLPPLAVTHRPALIVFVQSSASAVVASAQPTVQWIPILLAGWLCGALLLACWFWRAHVAFVRGLGLLAPDDLVFFSTLRSAGPVLIGLWRPKIVVPADFTARYTQLERRLIVEHERVHAQRGDAVANLLQASLQCVFWFNPLVHVAALFFRADQEMACDAAVLRKHPELRRTYARTLFKSHSFSHKIPPTIACTWRIHHPEKERFMNLQQTQPGLARRLTGRFLLASLVFSGGYAGMAARADDAPGTLYDMSFTVAGSPENSPHALTKTGDPFAITRPNWSAKFILRAVNPADRTFALKAALMDKAHTWHSDVNGHLGEKVSLSMGAEDVALVVNEIQVSPDEWMRSVTGGRTLPLPKEAP